MSQDNHQQLRKSHKMDFSNQAPLFSRERSFVRPNKEALKRRSQTMMAMRGKPTLEIYRPPNVRIDLPNKLNVHAKEFTMHHEPAPLQHSKSSGSLLRHHLGHGLLPLVPLPLLHSASSSHLLGYHPHFAPEMIAHPVFTGTNQPVYHPHPQVGWGGQRQAAAASLKRSKSLGAAESKQLREVAKEEVELGMFDAEHQVNLRLALEDPNRLPSRALMDLVKTILEKVVAGIKYSEAVAKLCVAIIDAETTHTFLESLLNTCQQWYQERDRVLRGVRADDGTRFTAFMWFLVELCGQLKRRRLRDHLVALLAVLARCCRACVGLPPVECLAETECLFFVLTSVGRDLEAELPELLEELLGSVRDGVLASAGSPKVRRTLLQLIELHASNWQLPGSSVLYYYPRVK